MRYRVLIICCWFQVTTTTNTLIELLKPEAVLNTSEVVTDALNKIRGSKKNKN